MSFLWARGGYKIIYSLRLTNCHFMVLTQMEVLTSPDMHFLNEDLVLKETVSLSPYNLLFGSPHTMLDSIRIIEGSLSLSLSLSDGDWHAAY